MRAILCSLSLVFLGGCVSQSSAPKEKADTIAASVTPTAVSEKLVGSWHYSGEEEDDQTTLTFRADGRFSIRVQMVKGSYVSISGRWSYAEEKIFYFYEESTAPFSEVAPGKKGVDVVEKITVDTLTVLQGPKRERVVFRRLTE